MKTQNVTLKTSEKLASIGSLSTMLTAGIPILEAVDSLLEDSKGNQRQILLTLKEDLMQGTRIYESFSKFPKVFDRVTISVIKASEEAGTLDTTLQDLKKTIQKETEFIDKVKSALIYPVFVMVVFVAVLLMILIVVVPKIATVFGKLRVTLPLPTRILIYLSNFLISNPLLIASGLLGCGFLMWFLMTKKRQALTEIFFNLPFVTTLIEYIDITRFSRSLHLLLYSGIPITVALELTKDVVMKKKTAQVISNCRDMVFAGKHFSEGLLVTRGYIPAIMIKLIEAGEKTGTLDKSMQEISEHFDYQVTQTLKTLTSLLEPLLLIAIGIVVGGMMLAIIAPIYNMIGLVGSR